LIDIGFLEDMEKELEELNKGRRGRPYRYSDGFVHFSWISVCICEELQNS